MRREAKDNNVAMVLETHFELIGEKERRIQITA